MKRSFLFLFVFLIVPLLVSCVGPARDLISSMDQLGPGQVVLVGKVEMTPRLDDKDQKLGGIGADGFKNKIFMITGAQWRELETPYSGGDYTGRIEAPLGKTFFAKSDANPFYILGGKIVMWVGSSPQTNDAYFPGGFKADIHPDDTAVYIGTLHYYRDEFFNVTKVEVDDEYDEALALFTKKFKGQGQLRKALLTRR